MKVKLFALVFLWGLVGLVYVSTVAGQSPPLRPAPRPVLDHVRASEPAPAHLVVGGEGDVDRRGGEFRRRPAPVIMNRRPTNGRALERVIADEYS